MRTVGIIAEYNPFHTGHAYQIRRAKELSGADYVVVVMSPDFVQHGEPAVFSKYVRVQMALQNGADLVLELPVCFAAGSAEYFAEGAVSLLDSLGVTDVLSFGAENDDPSLFQSVSGLLLHESDHYVKHLRESLRAGETWPTSRVRALTACLTGQQSYGSRPANPADIPDSRTVADFLAAPNNILGVEYCRAIRKRESRMLPLPVLREGAAFDSPALDGKYCSAAALRQWILEQPEAIPPSVLRYIPENCRELFCSSVGTSVTPEELLPFLMQKLLVGDTYSSVLDISSDLSDRIRRLRFACIGKTFRETVVLLKTKQLTESRLRRALLHLILDIHTADMEDFRADGCVYYARALGFRREASPLLHRIRISSSVPFLTRPARASALLQGAARRMWELDVYASHLYRGIQTARTHTRFRTEYEISPRIL